ncbi:MAG TPA: ACT domain-containing protein, partial [Nitrososphaerales archaeon]|nr:ACT domain-containing protein [Nitrososphaerales archaeon]
MPKVTQLVVPLVNRPGTLAHLCSTLGEAGVNITAILAPEGKKRGKVSLMVEDLDRAREALMGA